MRKKFIIISFLFIAVLPVFGQNGKMEELWQTSLNHSFEKAELYALTDTIFGDFNGDSAIDKAIFKSENSKYGILIIHGKTDEKIEIGLGKEFEEMGDNFEWIDFWGLVEDLCTYEIIIEDGEIFGEEEVQLHNPSIVIRKESAGGGLITFRCGKYEWIYQAD